MISPCTSLYIFPSFFSFLLKSWWKLIFNFRMGQSKGGQQSCETEPEYNLRGWGLRGLRSTGNKWRK